MGFIRYGIPKLCRFLRYVLRPVGTESTPELQDMSEQHHAAHCKDAVTYFRKARAANERCAPSGTVRNTGPRMNKWVALSVEYTEQTPNI